MSSINRTRTSDLLDACMDVFVICYVVGVVAWLVWQ